MSTAICEPVPASTSHLVPVSIFLFYPPAQLCVDTYVAGVDGKTGRYSTADFPPSASALDDLASKGVRTLYVPQPQVETLREEWASIASRGEKLSTVVRLELAKEAAKSVFANAWRTSEVDPIIQQASALAEGVLEACQGCDAWKGQLMRLLHHDGDTFTHITNVCTYAMLLAQNLGINQRESLMEIGVAALLHDIGKRQVSRDILQKPGKLSPAEMRIIADHPRRGFEELCHRGDLNWGQLLMVYQHHERQDGSGYPVGIDGSEIHSLAKLCAVVDVFDALTSRRAYRKSITAAEAVEYLESESPRRLDKEMVTCWKATVEMGISKSS